MKQDIFENYNSNRAPLGFYSFSKIFATWMKNQNFSFLFANKDKVIDWIKSPKKIADTKLMPQFQCITPNVFNKTNSCINRKTPQKFIFPDYKWYLVNFTTTNGTNNTNTINSTNTTNSANTTNSTNTTNFTNNTNSTNATNSTNSSNTNNTNTTIIAIPPIAQILIRKELLRSKIFNPSKKRIPTSLIFQKILSHN